MAGIFTHRLGAFNPAAGGGYSDPNLAFTTLLMGFEGEDGSTTFVDESPSGHTGWGVSGQAQIDTAQFKFGSSSALFDGSGDRISQGLNTDWKLHTGECTVECWIRPTAITNARWFLGHATGLDTADRNGSQWVLWAFGGVLRMSYNDGSAWREASETAPAATVVTNTWQHVAWERDAAGKLRLYHNGVMIGSRTPGVIGTTFPENIGSIGLYIGDPGDSGAGDYAGHMDEIRILKGKAAWASDSGFTPPSAPYARS